MPVTPAERLATRLETANRSQEQGGYRSSSAGVGDWQNRNSSKRARRVVCTTTAYGVEADVYDAGLVIWGTRARARVNKFGGLLGVTRVRHYSISTLAVLNYVYTYNVRASFCKPYCRSVLSRNETSSFILVFKRARVVYRRIMGAAASIAKPHAAREAAAAAAAAPLDCEAQQSDLWPALSQLLSLDFVNLPTNPDDKLWMRAFAEHLDALAAGVHPLRALAHEAIASPHFAGRAAHAFRAALHVLRGEPNPPEATAALAFAAELVRALRTNDPATRALVLGALDGSALSATECADIGLAALWQLAARALDLLCTPPLTPSVTAAACATVFSFLADSPDAGGCALLRIVERYASPPLVISSLLHIVEGAVIDGTSPNALINPTATSVSTRPAAAAAALANAVSTLANSITPRAIAAIAPSPRTIPSPTAISALNGVQPALQSSDVAPAKIRAASDALCLLLALVSTDIPGGAYRSALLSLRDAPNSTNPTSFRGVYSALCFWASHPAGSLLTEMLLSSNRKFRAYALSRTDPEALLVPLLRALHERCVPPPPAMDAYAPAAAILTLSSDPGFCEAIDTITIPTYLLSWADPRSRLANSPAPSLSALVLFVGARAVQQSLLTKRSPPQTYTASLILSAMANVAVATTSIHSPTADRLVSLLEFLGRRVRRTSTAAALSENSASDPTTTKTEETHNNDSQQNSDVAEYFLGGDVEAVLGGGEKDTLELCDTLISLTGLTLELVAGVLSSRGDVSSNRHLVYALLHREYLVRRDGPLAGLSSRCGALCARLERVVRYFGTQVDRAQPQPASDHSAAVLSVERVFAVIDDTARLLPQQLLAGLPQLRFEYRTAKNDRLTFLYFAVWDIVRRFAPYVARPPTTPPSTVTDALHIAGNEGT